MAFATFPAGILGKFSYYVPSLVCMIKNSQKNGGTYKLFLESNKSINEQNRGVLTVVLR